MRVVVSSALGVNLGALVGAQRGESKANTGINLIIRRLSILVHRK